MGKKLSGSAETETTRTDGQSNKHTDAGRAVDGGRSRGTGGRRGKQTASEDVGAKDSGLPVLEPKATTIEVPAASEEKPKAKRGRPSGSKTAKKKKEVAPAAVDHTQLSTLLLTITNVAASRDGLDMFALTPTEAEQIAKPLSNILAKNDSVGKVASEYADHIALLFAALTIIVPKVLLFLQKRKQEKERLQYEQYEYSPPDNQAGEIDTNPQQSDRENGHAAHGENANTQFNGRLDEFLPVTF